MMMYIQTVEYDTDPSQAVHVRISDGNTFRFFKMNFVFEGTLLKCLRLLIRRLLGNWWLISLLRKIKSARMMGNQNWQERRIRWISSRNGCRPISHSLMGCSASNAIITISFWHFICSVIIEMHCISSSDHDSGRCRPFTLWYVHPILCVWVNGKLEHIPNRLCNLIIWEQGQGKMGTLLAIRIRSASLSKSWNHDNNGGSTEGIQSCHWKCPSWCADFSLF